MKRSFPILLLALCAAMLVFGLFALFKLRFEAGDVYPPYSSLRADPLGTMGFYESLEKMPGVSVRRDFHQGNQLPEERNTTYLHLAASRFDWTELPADLEQEINAFLGRGGRLVVAFYPETTKRVRLFTPKAPPSAGTPPKMGPAKADNKTNPAKPKKIKPGNPGEMERAGPPPIPLKTRWGVDYAFVPLNQDENATYEPVQVVNLTALPLPPTLDWHSGLVFTNLDAAWRPIYARGTNPVVVERAFGRGTVVMATDSYFLSNEALHKERHADWLAWVVGSGREVVFDEAHLGIVETSGVAALMRKYGLEGLAAGLVLLGGLFIWKNSLSFVPPYPAEKSPGYVTGKEASAGFVNLLRRNLAPQDMLNVCFSEWTKSLGHGNSYPLARVDAAQAVLEAENARPPAARDPVRAYREVCRILQGGNG